MTNSAPAWETLDDINAAVRAAGLKEPSSFQLERWRNAHLLPPVRQLPDDYHGSHVEYPLGTARQSLRARPRSFDGAVMTNLPPSAVRESSASACPFGRRTYGKKLSGLQTRISR